MIVKSEPVCIYDSTYLTERKNYCRLVEHCRTIDVGTLLIVCDLKMFGI